MKRNVNALGAALRLYATILTVGAASLAAQTFTTLYNFGQTPQDLDGGLPMAGLAQAVDGSFYGSTSSTIFRITPSGVLTTLYDFCSLSGCADGQYPYAAPLPAANGDVYGTTTAGGAYNQGTVFRIPRNGMLTTIYSFCAQPGCPDGARPGALLQAANGEIYGITATGGAFFGGSIFKITPSGTLTTVYNFCSDGCAAGSSPTGFFQAANGDFYGTTSNGGTGSENSGAIFKLTLNGNFTTLYSFCSQAKCADGQYPSSLVQATNGTFYGTTSTGGHRQAGIFFKMTPAGALTVLHNFKDTDGAGPGSLFQATDGNFYGITGGGGSGSSYGGTIFKATPGGTVTTLYNFCSQRRRGADRDTPGHRREFLRNNRTGRSGLCRRHGL